jgi:hypothetical protein
LNEATCVVSLVSRNPEARWHLKLYGDGVYGDFGDAGSWVGNGPNYWL